MPTIRAVLLLLSTAACSAASALTIEYGSDRPEALAECDRADYRGERAAADTCYRSLLAGNEDPRIKAEAARTIGDVRTANTHFQTALENYPEDPSVRVRWGELFLATHQANEAVQLFLESLELDPEYVPAKLGLASVSAGRFEDKAREWVGEVLDADPENVQAMMLLARMDLEEGAIDRADEKLTEALAIVEENDLPPLEIYALKASVDLLNGTEASPWVERALEYNPTYGDIYATQAHFYVITRRYREAIALFRKAVDLQPQLYDAHAALGVNLLRENRIDEAQRHLALAYQGDPYSPQIVNTLRLIDSFENFAVVTHGPEENQVPGSEAQEAEAQDSEAPDSEAPESQAQERGVQGEPALPGIILRLHESEVEVLEPYVLDLVQRSITAFSERYNFELEEPVIVELYPNHDDFAVRTSGLPGIGLLGVTFGHLVAMDSPSGRPEGDFHWGTTLWHEMAHVFTLEATRHLVPRWFSEGVSVYEEWSTGPLPGRHLPLVLFESMKEDKLLPIAELDRGFIRPTYQAQVIVSYMQAGLICEYIAGRWGQEGLQKMLTLFDEGRETAEAVEGALGIAASQFDEDFGAFLAAEFDPVLENLEPWQEAQREAHESAGDNDWPKALAAATRAVELYPDYVDEGSAYLIKARAHQEASEQDMAVATLAEYHRRGGHDPAALRQLGDWLYESGEQARSVEVLEDILLVAPLQQELHADLGDRLLEVEQPARALVEYEAYAALDPHDQAGVNFRLARAYHALNDRERAREHLLYALEIAPHYREAQQLLLEIVR